MIRAIILGALALVVAFIFSLFVSVPGFAAGLHPECNVTIPCAAPVASVKPTPRREARRIARGQRLQQAMPFGAPIVPPETQRLFLSKGATILPHPAGCPRRAFCGCGAAVEVFGEPVRSLWLARNWLAFPRAAPAPGMVAAACPVAGWLCGGQSAWLIGPIAASPSVMAWTALIIVGAMNLP